MTTITPLASLPGLPDYLSPGLRLVFVGYNPSIAASKAGHYYANPANYFYRMIHLAGLTPALFTYHQDIDLPALGIGLTDLCPLPSAQVSHLPAGALRAGRTALRERLERCQPRVICFNGIGVYQVFLGRAPEGFGLQVDRIGESSVFVVPSTSPANNALLHERESAFLALGEYVRQIPRM